VNQRASSRGNLGLPLCFKIEASGAGVARGGGAWQSVL